MKLITTAYILWFIFWIVCAVGWVLNIIAIANTYTLELTGLFILRIIGVLVFPLGAVLGIFF